MGIYVQKNGIRNPIGGGTKELEKRLLAVERGRASETAYGLVKLTDSDAVTESTGLALSAGEKNAGRPGTMAYGFHKFCSRLKLMTSVALGFETGTQEPGVFTLNHHLGFKDTGYFIIAVPASTLNTGTEIFRAVNVDGDRTTFYARNTDGGPAPDVWVNIFAFGE